MKNMVFFVLLAVLTIAALVGVNVFRNKLPSQLFTRTVGTPTISPTPTGGAGGTSLRDSLGASITPGPSPTGYATTKGGIPLPTVTPTKGSTATYVAPTPMAGTDISYTSTGFTPKPLNVKVGTMVVFRNNSGRSMKVGGDFSQSISVGNGGIFQYQFVNAGTFTFHDDNNPTYTGTVIVTP